MKRMNILLALALSAAVLSGCASKGSYIGTDRAKTIALENAGVQEGDVVGLDVDLEQNENIYEVSFDALGYEYEYEIDAADGDILRQKRELDDDTRLPAATSEDLTPHDGAAPETEPEPEVTEAPETTAEPISETEPESAPAPASETQPEPKATEAAAETQAPKAEPASYISADEAKSAALKHSGCAAADIYDYDCEFETSSHCNHEGHSGECRYYDVSFDCDGYDYDYDIDAVTGEVLRYTKEADKDHHDDDHHDESAATPAVTQEATASTSSTSTYIGGEKARDIALNHAGYKSSEVYDLEYELDRERGVAVYDVSFDAEDYDYDYEIDAATGDILRSDKKWDNDYKPDPALNSSEYIGSESAKAKALEHAGLSASEVRELEVELEHRLNSVVYEVSFDAAGYEYDYTINATSGEVVSSKKERD